MRFAAWAAATVCIGDRPRIRGAVGAVIHWPRWLILSLAALPGPAILAGTALRRRRPEQGRPPPAEDGPIAV